METRITIAQMDEALEKFKQKISSDFIVGEVLPSIITDSSALPVTLTWRLKSERVTGT